MRRIRPFYRKVRSTWKVGDDNLDTFIAIIIGVVTIPNSIVTTRYVPKGVGKQEDNTTTLP